MPLEPNSQQEPFTYSRRGSATDPAGFLDYRRPSMTDSNNLPLPNSNVVSRRGSLATTDYDFSSRSPSPAPPLSSSKRYLETNGHYDLFQRRHSIATEPINHHQRNPTSKQRAFRFPATIQELSADYNKIYSAPSSPPAPPQFMNHQEDINYNNRLHPNGNTHARPSILEDNDPHLVDHLLVRRASMPSVTTTNNRNYYSSIPPPPLPKQHHRVIQEEEKRKETPYSRSPELRISHKLAERKRRKEMKELFDELRNSLPVDKNIKTSKWEILSKAVEYISLLKRRDFDMENEISSLRREIETIKREKMMQKEE
ncbi:MAG: hypothetical protein EXX96DRAFT_474661 [Benjaminiella poitrasii]|nr:MAG: hypothetical protein EXX96DRAFT_474661 [Benjaminiella poitrasii]